MIFKCKPIKSNKVSQPFKEATHKGIDYSAPNGTPVYAVADGVVVAAGNSPWDSKGSYGYQVAIAHGDGNYTNYAHLKKGSICVAVGAKVSAGQKIALSNNSGTSTGPHLHFELHLGKKWARIDAKPYIDNLGVDPQKMYNYVVKTNGSNLIVREKPDAGSKALGKLANGTPVHSVKTEGAWLHIDKPKKGYIYKNYTKKK